MPARPGKRERQQRAGQRGCRRAEPGGTQTKEERERGVRRARRVSGGPEGARVGGGVAEGGGGGKSEGISESCVQGEVRDYFLGFTLHRTLSLILSNGPRF